MSDRVNKDEVIRTRVDSDLKHEFEMACLLRSEKPSRVLRALMQGYVDKHWRRGEEPLDPIDHIAPQYGTE